MGIKLTEQPHKAIAGFVVVVAVTTLAWWFIRQPDVVPDTSPATIVESIDIVDEPETGIGTSVEQDEDTESVEAARQIVHVPDSQTQSAGVEKLAASEVTGANVAEFTRLILTNALDGDLNSTEYIRDLNMACSIAAVDDEALEKNIQNLMSSVKRLIDKNHTIPPEGVLYRSFGIREQRLSMRMFPTEQQNRDHLTQWYHGCRKVNRIFNENLRKELEALARKGHVMARYIYALWKPKAVMEKGAIDRALLWQMNAVEFSYANLEEGELAGVLAFGHSYIEALFTYTDLALAIALYKAAFDCGFESAEIQMWITEYLGEGKENVLQRATGATHHEVEALAAEFARNCR